MDSPPYNEPVSRERTERRPDEKRELQRAIMRRRRKFALGVAFILIAAIFYLWAIFFSGRLVLVREASAEDVTRGALFGPFYIDGGVTSLYSCRILVPATSGPWETKAELLDSNMLVIHPQTDFILAGAGAFDSPRIHSRTSTFRLRDGGYYFLRFTQVNGTYPESMTAVRAGAPAPPVMRLLVRTRVVRGWELWLPLSLLALAFLAMVILM